MQLLPHQHITINQSEAESRYAVSTAESLYEDLSFAEAQELAQELQDDPQQRHIEIIFDGDSAHTPIEMGHGEQLSVDMSYWFQRRTLDGQYAGQPFRALLSRIFLENTPLSFVVVEIADYAGDHRRLKAELEDAAPRYI